MSIKTHFPLFLLCMNRMLPCIDSYRIVEPNPLHDLSFVHSSKQTIIQSTALSPGSCVVIQEEECNHTLGSLTPLSLLTHPFRCPDVAVVRISSKFVAW